jgi:hypothetical protein
MDLQEALRILWEADRLTNDEYFKLSELCQEKSHESYKEAMDKALKILHEERAAL